MYDIFLKRTKVKVGHGAWVVGRVTPKSQILNPNLKLSSSTNFNTHTVTWQVQVPLSDQVLQPLVYIY